MTPLIINNLDIYNRIFGRKCVYQGLFNLLWYGIKERKEKKCYSIAAQGRRQPLQGNDFSLQLSLIVKKGNYVHKSQDETLSTTAQLSPKQTFKIMFL